MSELTNRIRKHNSWRRGEHDDMCNAMQLGNDLDALSNDLDKLTDQNKMLRDALSLVVDKLPMYKNTITGYSISLSDDDCRIIKETLNISEL